jgi:hypothetical protein
LGDQVNLLYKDEFPSGAYISNALLYNIKAKTVKDRMAGLNASAALMRDLQARAEKGEIEYVAIFSSIINTKNVEKATKQALNDVKSPLVNQFVHGSASSPASAMDQSKRILMGVVWSEVKLLETGARFPELATADTTCKTNKQGRPLLKIQGLDGNGKMFTRANALLWNESEEAFLFVFKFALPKLWSDPVCQATSLFITDGDPHMISALKNALATTSFSECTLKRCFWHLVHQAFAKLFGNGELDLEVNTVIRKWLNSLAYRVESVEDFDESMEELKQWIRSNVDTSLMPRQKKQIVQISRVERMLQFIDSIEGLKKTWAKCHRLGLCDLGHITTSLSEAGFSKLKGWHLAVHAQMGINATVDTMRKQEQLSIAKHDCDADRLLSTHPLPNKFQSDAAVRLGVVLTPRAVDEIDQQFKQSTKMTKQAVAGRWRVCYTTVAEDDCMQSGDSEDDIDTSAECRPWPKFVYTREVHVKNGKLFCSCKYSSSLLLPCRHIICVKGGTLSARDCHYRWSLAWQAERIPLTALSRTFEDQESYGATLDGVASGELLDLSRTAGEIDGHVADDYEPFAGDHDEDVVWPTQVCVDINSVYATFVLLHGDGASYCTGAA